MCGLLLSNNSMKSIKLEQHQKAKHPSSIGKDRKDFEEKISKKQITLPSFMKQTAETTKTIKPSFLVSELIAKVGAPMTAGEKLVKPAMLLCVKDEEAASSFLFFRLLQFIIFLKSLSYSEELKSSK